MNRMWLSALALTVLAVVPAAAQDKKKKETPVAKDSFYSLSTKTLEGQPADLKDYSGKGALIVNVASQCGNTPQYTGLEKLYEELKGKNFVILGFPSNDFGGQEPGSPEEIRTFCTSKYKVSFPMFEKVVTKAGANQSPIYAHLSKGVNGELPNWNFSKYLVDKNGKVVKYYKANIKPEDSTLRADIEAALK